MSAEKKEREPYGHDGTDWPSRDAAGNNLRHTEDCAWRFGGACDCDPSRDRLRAVEDAAAELVEQPFGQLNQRSFYRLREALAGEAG